MTEKLKTSTYLKTVAIDVDGVLNSYKSGWTAADHMPDAPNPGAMAFLKSLVEDGRFEVCIVSSRLNHPNGEDAVKVWLWNHIFCELRERDPESILKKIRFSVERPPATVTLDDRALTFMGEWPSMDRLAAFQPFYKKPAHLRPDPLTSVAAIDALMTRIGRVAQETGCPDGVQALDWLEKSARLRRQGLIDWAKAELAKDPAMDPEFIADEAQTRRFLEAMHEADLLVSLQRLEDEVYRRKEAGRIPFEDDEPGSDAYEGLLDQVVGRIVDQAVAGAEGMPAAGTEAEKAARRVGAERALGLLCIDPAVRIEVNGEIPEDDDDRPTVDGLPVMSIDELSKPVMRWDSFETGEVWETRAGGKVELIRQRQDAFSDPAVKAEGRAEIDALISRTERARGLRSLLETAWDLGAGTAYARRDRPADYEADGKTDETIRAADVGRVLAQVDGAVDVPERALRYAVAKADRLDAEFERHAAIEALILDAVPPGTPVVRASAGGDLGWRVGRGWMSVEGSDPSRPDQIRDFARSLAAIPGMAGEAPRAGDPELVERTLAAGRALR